MKQKFLIILMMAVGLVACALDDEAGTKWEPKTETWTVTIEPEYVMGHSWWGAYSGIGVQMVGANEEGKRVGAFYLGEIKGFTFEEGYRYKLRIEATTTDPRIADASAYDFKQGVCGHPYRRPTGSDDGRADGVNADSRSCFIARFLLPLREERRWRRNT